MTIFDLLFAWKLKMLKWALYAFIFTMIVVIIILKTLNFSITHSFIEDGIYSYSGWEVDLGDESHIGWLNGPSFDADNVTFTKPVAAKVSGLEIPIYKIISIWGGFERDADFEITGKQLEIDNFLFKDVRLISRVQDYETINLYVSADSGQLNTGMGDPDISQLLNNVLPAGNNSDELECLSAPLVIEGNILKSDQTVMETGSAYLLWQGQVDFGTEILDIKITPTAKKKMSGVTAAPVYVTGSFSEPVFTVRPDDILKRMRMLMNGKAEDQKPKIECNEEIL